MTQSRVILLFILLSLASTSSMGLEQQGQKQRGSLRGRDLKKKCSDVICDVVDCLPGYYPYGPPGQCCQDQCRAGEGEVCGSTRCDPGLVCCNESCGICTPLGGVCTQEICGDGA